MSENLRGALLMVAAMSGFAINDGFMKELLKDVPIFQGLVVRGLIASMLLGAVVAMTCGWPRLRARTWALLSLRTGVEICAVWTFMQALVAMPFANISAILQALPLTVTLGAALFLGQPIGWRRLAAIGVGMIGVLLIIRPGTAGFSSASVFVVICVGFATARDLLSRSLPEKVPAFFVAGFTSAGITLFMGIGAMASGDWVAIGLREITLAACASVFLMVAYTAIFSAMQAGEIAFIAPFRYSSLIVSILIGLLFFAEVPDGWMLLGAAIVVAMGCFTFWREQRLGQAAADAPGRNS